MVAGWENEAAEGSKKQEGGHFPSPAGAHL